MSAAHKKIAATQAAKNQVSEHSNRPVGSVLSRAPWLRRVREGRYRGPCPNCGGNKHSSKFFVTERPDGALLLHCFSGCSASAIVARLGLDFVDLFPANEPALQRKRNGRRRDRLDAETGLRLITGEAHRAALLIAVMARHDLTSERRNRLLEAAHSISLTLKACGLREAA